jgi:two-component system, NtrC family, sensor kinase
MTAGPDASRDVAMGEGGLLRRVVDSLDARMCILGAGGEIVATNRLWDEFAAAMAWPPAETGPGAPFFDLLRRVPADLGDLLGDLVRDVLAGLVPQNSLKAYLPVPTGGEDVVVRVHHVHDHDVARAVVIMIDISDAARTQRELTRITDEAQVQLQAAIRQARALTEELSAEKSLLSDVLGSIPHLVYWKDAELRYAGVNPTFLAVRGLAGESAVLERTEAEVDAGDELSAALAQIEPQVLATGVAVENQRLLLTAADRPPCSLLLSVLPQIDDEGRVCGVSGVAADVTHVSTLEQQLAQATRLESIGQLAAGIAHEINTPVQYVSDNTRFVADTFGEVLAALQAVERLSVGDDPPAARLREILAPVDLAFLAEEIPSALAQSQEGLARVSQIVRAMKDFSHPGQGRAEADLNRAVESTAQVSRNEWRYVATLDLDLDPEVRMVRCYEGELKQVLLNIVVNAAQAIGDHRDAGTVAAAGAGGAGGGVDPGTTPGRIVIRTRRLEGGVRITIEDDGPGIDEAVQTKIFDPFFTTKPVGKGTGQGLSMAYAIVVQKHGGSLSVSSTPGVGTTFTIDLPDDPEP